MREFAYERAASVDAAVAAGGTYLGGGTNLVDLMKLGVEAPERLVDVSRLPGDVQATGDGGVRIGASVRNADAAAHELVPPLLREALLAGASRPLRNVATAGGHPLPRPPRPHLPDGSQPCNKR